MDGPILLLTEAEVTAIRELMPAIRQMQHSMERIETAITGDERMGQKGIVTRLAMLEETVTRHDQKLISWGSAFAVLTVLIQMGWNYFIKKSS